MTSENQTLGGLWEGWEVTEVRPKCTAVSHAIFNSATVLVILAMPRPAPPHTHPAPAEHPR